MTPLLPPGDAMPEDSYPNPLDYPYFHRYYADLPRYCSERELRQLLAKINSLFPAGPEPKSYVSPEQPPDDRFLPNWRDRGGRSSYLEDLEYAVQHFPKVLVDEVLEELAARQTIYQRSKRVRHDYDYQKAIEDDNYRPSSEAIKELCENQNAALYQIGDDLYKLLKQRQSQIQRED